MVQMSKKTWDSVRVTSSYYFIWPLDLFWRLGVLPIIYIAPVPWGKNKLRNTALGTLHMVNPENTKRTRNYTIPLFTTNISGNDQIKYWYEDGPKVKLKQLFWNDKIWGNLVPMSNIFVRIKKFLVDKIRNRVSPVRGFYWGQDPPDRSCFPRIRKFRRIRGRCVGEDQKGSENRCPVKRIQLKTENKSGVNPI